MQRDRILAAGVVCATFGLAAQLHAETLDEALVSTYTTNTTLLAQRAQTRATDELVPQALANWRPTVKLSADVGIGSLQTNEVGPVNQAQVPQVSDQSVTISQPLYRGGQTVAQTAQAEAQVKAQRAQLEVTEETVLLDTATAYMDVVQNQAVVELNKNNEKVLQRQYEATSDRFRVGEVTRTDVAQAQAALSGSHADRRQAEADLQGSIANYVAVVGHAPQNLKAPNPLTDLPGSLDESKAMAGDSNPAVVAQKYVYEAATHGIDLAYGALLPEVSLQGSYVRQVNEFEKGSYLRDVQALLNVTVPLYQQGEEYSRLRQQKHTAGQQKIQLDETRRQAIQQATQAWENLQAARARVSSYDDEIKAAKVALEGIQRESLVGSRTVLDVLTTEQDLLSAEVNLVRAQHDVIVGAYQLKSAVGQLTAKQLKLPVPIYDPTQHYNQVRDQWAGTAISPDYGEGK